MRKLPIQALFGLSLLAFAAGFDYLFMHYQLRDFYRADFAKAADNLEQDSLLTKTYFDIKNDIIEVENLLNEQHRAGRVSFWAILHRGEPYKTNITDQEYPYFDFLLDSPGTIHLSKLRDGTPNYAYITENLSSEFDLVIGLRYNAALYVQKAIEVNKKYIFKYVGAISLGGFLIVLFFFKDILASIKTLASDKGRNFQVVRTRSREAELLVRGVAAYEDRTARLEQERELLKWQVLPSLRTELMSGRKPPYDFECTLVRTDINNFSKIYNDYSVDEFTQTINEFFTEVSHIVSRYGGLVHEFVGDEVIFYFKDEDVGNSVLMSLYALRDINAAATKISQMTFKKRGYPFTVKSSLAHGKIRFAQFVNGFSLAGPSLIETVRILSQVVEKSGNVVVFDDRHMKWVDDLVEAGSYVNVTLKGFNFERRLLIFRGCKPIHGLLAEENFDALSFYRSDSDISLLIQKAKEFTEQAQYRSAQKIVGMMRHFPVTQSDGTPGLELSAWVEEMLKEISSLEGEKITSSQENMLRTVSSAIRLFENLIPRSDFSAEIEKLLQKATQLSDRRIVANALDVLSHFKSEGDPAFLAKLTKHEDNRVAANALVHEGLRGLSPFVLRRLKKMLGSRRNSHVASALYAVGELAQYHRNRDLIYYSTQLEFIRMIQDLPDFVLHEEPMIRRQSMIAARKSQDAEVIALIREKIQKSGKAELEKEALEYLGDSAETSVIIAAKAA